MVADLPPILFATPELAPWVKTGGLGDVAAALPVALHQQGLDVRVLVPYYPSLRQVFPDAPLATRLSGLGGHFCDAALREACTPDGTRLWLLDCPDYYDRPGNPYLGPEGHDWLDNHLRFGLLSRVAAWLGSDECPKKWRCGLIHCNDWQTALAPAYLRYLPGARARSLVTIHNLAFQGLFGRETLPALGLPESSWSLEGVEYYGHLSFLKAGLQAADGITTVSPSYAREIQTPEEGMGMDGLLRYRQQQLSGILNGIDTRQWDPATDIHIASPYDARHLEHKALNKAELQREMGLPVLDDRPLLGVVSRLTHQKGLDLLAEITARIVALPTQLVLLGNGEKPLEQAFQSLATHFPDQVAIKIGFDEGLAHRIEAGADIFLMPSRFEPCGLNQMYSLRYGTVPLVRTTGGLADTVMDAVNTAPDQANGFRFDEATPTALEQAVRRAVATWQDPDGWRKLQTKGMAQDWSWATPAQQYAQCYRRIIRAP